jgi:plasmid stabilization system protein ParE
MKVRLSDEAARDLEKIGDYIAADDPVRADRFVAELVSACDGLGEFPNRFPLVSRYLGAAIRHRAYGDYLILYQVGGHEVMVVRIVHGATDYAALLSSR